MLIEQAQVLSNQDKGSGIFLLRLSSQKIASTAKVGQFVQLQISDNSYDPLLRRPFCIYNDDNGELEILYHVVGKGTDILSRKQSGSELSLLGPLGNGFIIKPGRKALLIGGGMGWAALNQLVHELERERLEFYPFSGAKNYEFFLATGAADIIPIDFSATDDGSSGYYGFITKRVEKWLEENNSDKFYIFACGPIPMLRAVQKLAKKHGLNGQMSLEARMACGFGVCLGCVVKKAKGDGFFKVCKDGPVFALDEISFDE